MVAVLCAATVAAGGIATAAASRDGVSQQERPQISTAPIEHGTLSGSRTVSGVLDYADTHDLQSRLGGTLTQLPDAGRLIGMGGELYRVDNAPVHLLRGGAPAWRAFERGMTKGADILQLESSLRDLGFFDAVPDETFNWRTETAIDKWQKTTGQRQTGRIDFGRVVFAPTDLRIGEVKAVIGDSVNPGAPLYQVSGLNKQITGDVKLADQTYAQVGAQVQINLPGRVTTTGTITAVGQPEERDNNGRPSSVIPIVITLDDPAAVDALQRANVTVDLPSETRENVLSVPVDALLALPGGSFGVELVSADGTKRQVPVDVGLFAGGRVEVSGEGIEPGLDVAVPKR
ncbi:HlyD family efflux transporter periplasmic adaptor subunit [Dactylosporangium sp. NPDC049525]|uniref:efflux RND transporter periplasmic adaptor subunit n=1 Tax=Dactylosporangium sp. NPDC049525 TaxID=3154730 RepID=UPI0034353B71